MSQRPSHRPESKRSQAERIGHGLGIASNLLLLLIGVGSVIYGLLFIFGLIETKDKLASGAGLVASGIFAIILITEKS